MLKGGFKQEADFVRFDGVVVDKPHPTARFRVAVRCGSAGGQSILDKDGNLQKIYHVKVSDLHKRRRKLMRQGVDPIETDRAINAAVIRGLQDALPRLRVPPPRPFGD